MNRAEDNQFERYCRTGATDALAAAFDATAPELWRVAWYLAGGARHLAEDALQSTFLTAIEDRTRWDESRPLRQWLLGILANHVRNHRRKSRKAAGVEMILDAVPVEHRPEDRAAETELRAAVADAIRQQPQPYREVLSLHLEHGLSSQEIANSLDRKPGTVRTQIARGLESLRAALPIGAAAVAALALPDAGLAAQVLGRVRDAVLAHGSIAVAATSPTVLTLLLRPRSIVMMTSFCACLVATALLWPESSVVPTPHDVDGPERVTSHAVVEDAGSAERALVRAPDGIEQPATVEVTEGVSVKVLVLGSDGQPLANAPLMFKAGHRQQYATANAEGRAVFRDLGDIDEYQVAVVGRDVSVAKIRPTEDFGGEHVLTLMPGMHLDVRVVDRNGDPVSGAMVEGILGSQWERMYNPLGRTGQDGVLRLRDIERRPRLRAFAANHQLSRQYSFTGQVGETLEVTLKLGAAAVAASGRVVNEAGDPVVGATIAVVQFGRSVTKQYTESGPEGQFRVDWLEPGRHMIVGRVFDGEVTRIGQVRFEHHGTGDPELTLELRPGASLRGTLTNAAGEAMANAGVYAQYSCDGVHDVPFTQQSVRTDSQGGYELSGLLAGLTRCRADADGPDLYEEIEVSDGIDNIWDPCLKSPQSISAQIVDQRGQPLVGWRASMWGLKGYGTGRNTVTGEDGMAGHQPMSGWKLGADELRGIAVFAPVPEGVKALGWGSHDYFPTFVSPPVGPAPTPHVIRVPDGRHVDCAIEGRLLDSGGTAHPRTSVTVHSQRASSAYDVVVWADEETGRFVVEPLSPGRYTLRFSVPGEPGFSRTITVGNSERVKLDDVLAPQTGVVTVRPTESLSTEDQFHASIECADGAWFTARRQDDGSYVAKGVHRGAATLITWGETIAPRRRAITVGETTPLEVELTRTVATEVVVHLPADQERSLQAWGGTLRVFSSNNRDLLLSRRVWHPFRGVYSRELKFSLPLEPGDYHVQLKSRDVRGAHTRVELPKDKIELWLTSK